MTRFMVLCGCLFVLARSASADVRDPEIDALRAQVRVLTERLERLEQQMAHSDLDTAEAPADPPAANPTANSGRTIEDVSVAKVDERIAAVRESGRIAWSGDFRYRYDDIEVEGAGDSNRNRIRARALLQARLADTMRVGFGLASGGDDPVSSNQTLGDGGSRKDAGIDLAYFEWTGLDRLTVTGGKFRNPLESVGGNQLLFDGDWRPEGIAFRFDTGNYFVTGIGTWLESDSRKPEKEFSAGLQGGFRMPAGEHLRLVAGAAYYHIDAAGKGPFFADGDFSGNSFDPVTGTYLFDYRLLEGFAGLEFDLLGRPALLFGDYVQNLDADRRDTGYTFGLQYGKAASAGDWSFGYSYRKVEADAVLGLLTESDFGGGGTDVKGSILKAAYAPHENWKFELAYLINTNRLSSGDPRDFDRLQLDLNFRYR